jgi:hypothetical protein
MEISLIAHGFQLPGAEDSFEEKKYPTAAYLRKYMIAAAPSSRHKIARASSSGIIQAVFIRNPPDADLVEAEIAVFGGFWRCQTLDRGSHALMPVTLAPERAKC